MLQSCVRSFRENYVQSYHLVRRLRVQKLSYKKSVWKIMSKNYKYHKSYAEKNIILVVTLKRISPDICLKKVVHIYYN